MMANDGNFGHQGGEMKFFDGVATLVVIALFFVALLLNVLAPKVSPAVAPANGQSAPAPEAPARPLSLCKALLQEVIDGDYKGFRAECFREGDSEMKLALAQAGSREAFDRASETISSVCREGYELEFLAGMNQQGSDIYLWKLIPAAGDNQFLVRLALRNGKISGFFFQ